MSIRVMDRVIHAKIGEYVARYRPAGERQDVSNPLLKFVLYKMADWGADDGTSIYPAVPTIAKLTEMSERTVQRAIAELVRSGLLIVVKEGGGQLATEYRIAVEKLMQLDLFAETVHRKPARKSVVLAKMETTFGVDPSPPVDKPADNPVENDRCQIVTGDNQSVTGDSKPSVTGDSKSPSTIIIKPSKNHHNGEVISLAFRRMMESYPRDIDTEGAEAAFRMEVAKGVDPNHIADAAAVFAQQVVREGREERFIPYPSNWLAKGLYRPAMEVLARQQEADEKATKDLGAVPQWAEDAKDLDAGARMWLRGSVLDGRSALGDKAYLRVPRRSQRDYLNNHYSTEICLALGVKGVQIDLMASP